MKGSCLCEAVVVRLARFEPRGLKCYCTHCRKVSGSAFAAVVLTRPEAFTVETGREHLAYFESTAGTERHHCRRCFAHVYTRVRDRPDVPLFVSASLFDPSALTQVRFDHIFVASIAAWHQLPEDGARRFAEFPIDQA